MSDMRDTANSLDLLRLSLLGKGNCTGSFPINAGIVRLRDGTGHDGGGEFKSRGPDHSILAAKKRRPHRNLLGSVRAVRPGTSRISSAQP